MGWEERRVLVWVVRMLFFSRKLKRAKRRAKCSFCDGTSARKSAEQSTIAETGVCAVYPPSTMMSWPLMKAAPGELSQSTALAISLAQRDAAGHGPAPCGLAAAAREPIASSLSNRGRIEAKYVLRFHRDRRFYNPRTRIASRQPVRRIPKSYIWALSHLVWTLEKCNDCC
jgi:hypothetical protein